MKIHIAAQGGRFDVTTISDSSDLRHRTKLFLASRLSRSVHLEIPTSAALGGGSDASAEDAGSGAHAVQLSRE